MAKPAFSPAPRPGPAVRGAAARPSLRSALAVAATTLGWLRPRGQGADLSAVQRHQFEGPGGISLSYLARAPGRAAGGCAQPVAQPVARLVLVHGTPGSAAGWGEWLADPLPGFEVLAPDRPGFGASGPAHALTSLAAQADLLAAALLLEDGTPNVVVGHSLGGAVAACTAVRHGRRVHALVLLAAALDPDLERTHLLQRLARRGPLRALLPRAILHANDELLALKAELTALAPQLPGIRCPVFIVHGTHDTLVPVANVRYLQQRLAGAPQVVSELLGGHDHFLPWNAMPPLRRIIAAAGAAAC